MLALRAGWHPFGIVANSQGILKEERKWCIEVVAFTWSNDGDNITDANRTDDLDKVNALEISSALRYDRFAVDLQYNQFDAELNDLNVNMGLYKNSKTDLQQFSIEGAYAFSINRFEWVAGYESQDADGYADAWTKLSTGFNYYVHGHDLKYQATYSKGDNVKGTANSEVDELYVQLQLIF
jgi:hypothetical protein